MKKLLNISLLAVILTTWAAQLAAQKFGHLNSASVLAAMPGVTEADQALKTYQDSLVAIGEATAAQLKKDFDAFMLEYNGGNVPPVKAQEKQASFQAREQELIQYEQEIFDLVNQRRQVLLAPLIDKLQDAINTIGKEGKYQIIFETGATASGFNALLFAPEADNIEGLVKAKLGMN